MAEKKNSVIDGAIILGLPPKRAANCAVAQIRTGRGAE